VSINLGDQLATYVGWLAPWAVGHSGRPVVVIGADPEAVEVARRQLVRIGVDDVLATWGAPDELGEPTSYRRATFAELAAERGPGDVVVDVRRTDEHTTGRVRGAVNLPLHELESRRSEVPSGSRVWLHCAAGFRSGTGASLLERHGFDVVHVDDSFDQAVEVGLTEG
jgi:hydroxyacylglutathione hydrolase